MSSPYSDQPNLPIPDAFPWGVAVFSQRSGLMLQCNQHMRTHYFGAESRGVALESIFGFREAKGFYAVLEQLAIGKSWSGRVSALRSRHGISSVELMIHRDVEDSDRLWVYTLEHPSVDGVLRFSSRSEMQLLQVLLDNTLEYVFFRDLQGRFILTNRAFDVAVSTGMGRPESPVGQRLDDFISSETASWIHDIDQRVLSAGVPSVNNVAHFVFNNGTRHWLQMSTVPVRSGQGLVVGSVSVARDISDLKRTESELMTAMKEAQAANRAKGEFLAAMSHEIRTPINGVIGASELCQETELDAEQRAYLDTVIQCGNTLLSLVNDVLDFSKIEAGQLNLEQLNFNPEAVLEEVIEEFAGTVKKKGIELILSCDDRMPKYVIGDPTRLKQIFYNLLGNAVKFTEAGEIVLSAHIVERSAQLAVIRFKVRDTGIGISETRREAIFSSFTQEDMSTTRRYGGTGLGLAICKELTELMAGSLSVDSRVGEGSTFTLEVPFELSSTPGIEAVPFNSELVDLRVLVVDDNPTNREIYQRMCRGWGYRCETASEGGEALRMLEHYASTDDPFRLVILDQQMMGVTGLDLASLIRNRQEMRDLKMILLSSSLNRSEAERAASLKIARALAKPIKRSVLLEVILETFGIRSPLCGDLDVSAAEAEKASTLHILLAEDNEVNQNIAKRRLKKLGHEVTVAVNGHEALEQVAQHDFDCILMDIQMPGMDGYEATQEIRNLEIQDGRSRHFIVAMTAHAMEGDAERCFANDMDEYISKPFRVERLQEVLEIAQERRRISASAGPRTPSCDSRQLGLLQYYESLTEEDQGDLLSAAAVMERTVPQDICKLQYAVREKNLELTRFMAHTLKGVAGIFNEREVQRLGKDIEQACDEGAFGRAEPLVDQLIESLDALVDQVRVLLRDVAGGQK